MSAVTTPACASLANIIVATDFSDRAHLTTQFAAVLARACGRGRICLVHVVSIAPLNPILANPLLVPSPRETRDPHDRLRESVADIDFSGIRLSFEVRAGDLATALEDVCVEEHADAIAVGTSGREGVDKIVRGSAAENVMRSELCPVLVVGPRVAAECMDSDHQRVLFATDFALGSVHALGYAVAGTNAFRAVLIALNVVEREIVASQYGDPTFVEQVVTDSRKEVQDMLPFGVAGEALVEVGVPWETIVRIARERKAKLIVMGRRPHSPLFAAHVPWTTAHRVICHAPCPVLTVR